MTDLLKQHENITDEFIDSLDQGNWTDIKQYLKSLHAADIADVIEAIPRDMRELVWKQVDISVMGEVLLSLHGEVRQQIISITSDDEMLQALQLLQLDEIADLDDDLPVSMVDAMVAAMDTSRRERYQAVKSYPDDTAGGLMDIDAVAVRADVNMKAVLRFMQRTRNQLGSLPEHLDSLMVVDRNNTFLGTISLGDVASLPTDMTVRHVMSTDLKGIPDKTSARQVARIFEDRDLLSAPVVDDNDRLLGRITIDDVVDVMREEAEQAVLSRAGLTTEVDMFAPIVTSASRRAIWLGINLLTTFIAAWVIGLFESSIEKIVALAVLMPVVASMGGIAGTQTLTLVTRGMALDQIGQKNIWRLLKRELAQGLLNGIFWAFIVAAIAVLWFGDSQLGMIFGIALILNLITGALAGTLVPFTLHRIGIDPALAGGVVLTTATDVIGFLSFLGLATLVLL